MKRETSCVEQSEQVGIIETRYKIYISVLHQYALQLTLN